jgi:succinyl-diaminopimelate desuccinylase
MVRIEMDLIEKISSMEEEMIDFLGDIISVPAVGPLSGGTGEMEKSKLILKYISTWGFEDHIHHDAKDPGVPGGLRPNIEVRVKGKDPSRRFVLIAHMDVVPPGDLGNWTGNPYKMIREEEKLIGRGVEDNGQALTASLFAIKALKDLNIEPVHDISLFLVSDEEETNLKGIGHLLDENLLKKTDLILVPDHGDPEGLIIELCEKTLLWVKVNVKGK